MLDLHGTDCVGGHDVFFDELDLDDPICLYSFLWPIHVTFSLKNGNIKIKIMIEQQQQKLN